MVQIVPQTLKRGPIWWIGRQLEDTDVFRFQKLCLTHRHEANYHVYSGHCVDKELDDGTQNLIQVPCCVRVPLNDLQLSLMSMTFAPQQNITPPAPWTTLQTTFKSSKCSPPWRFTCSYICSRAHCLPSASQMSKQNLSVKRTFLKCARVHRKMFFSPLKSSMLDHVCGNDELDSLRQLRVVRAEILWSFQRRTSWAVWVAGLKRSCSRYIFRAWTSAGMRWIGRGCGTIVLGRIWRIMGDLL